MHDVYISHSSKDIKRIQELQSYIEKNNYSCFLATNPNENPNDEDFYMEKIGHEMYYAKTFLLTISKNSLNSVQVKREMRLADKYNKKIIPVILDDTDPEDKKNNNIFSIDYLTAGTQYLY